MITLLIGENSFEIERALGEIASGFNGRVEKIDGSNLQLKDLPDILMGVSLFATDRVVVIRGLGQNKSIWPVFGSWLDKISDDIHLILVEAKPDKRTSTFKALKEFATVKEFSIFSDRDLAKVEDWTAKEAAKIGLKLDKKSIQFLVARVGFDQWQLSFALQKIALIDDVSIDKIKDIIEPNLVENVFNLFETAISGDTAELKYLLAVLERSEDPYRLSSLLFAQGFQLAVLSGAEKTDSVAKDFGIHPFVVSKLSVLAKKIGSKNIKKIIEIFITADDDLKISKADPWVLIRQLLMKISLIQK